MNIGKIICDKLETLLGNNYKLFPISHFNRRYTEAKLVAQGNDYGYIRDYNKNYGELRKDYIIGTLTLSNAIRSNVSGYYLASGYSIRFSVPRNIERVDKYDRALEPKPFDFEEDIYNLITSTINQVIEFDTTYKGKMTISEPSYVQTETDGEFDYDIMQVSGNIVISDDVKFGSEYEVKFLIDGEYVGVDDINSYSEVYNTDNNAIVVDGKAKVEQDLSQLAFVVTFSIDDKESNNLARELIYDTVHENREIINANGSTEALKRKIRTKITSPYGNEHNFNAILGVTFNTTKNGVGTYNVSLTDDNKGLAQFTLSFNSDGGSSVEAKVITDGNKIGELETPTKDGYTFEGWAIDDALINSNKIYTYGENKIATAIWGTTGIVYFGLNEDGEIATENIVSYAIGDGNSQTGIEQGFNSTDINIPMFHNGKPVIKINDYAFSGYSLLETTKIGKNIESIGENAYGDCINLNLVDFNTNKLNRIRAFTFTGCTSLTNIVLPNGLKEVRGGFEDCSNLELIDIPESVEYIQDGAFQGLTNLNIVKIRTNYIRQKVTYWTNSWFYGCSSTLVLHIPQAITNPSDIYGEYWNYYSNVGTLTWVNDL